MKYCNKQMRLPKFFSVLFCLIVINSGFSQLVVEKGIDKVSLIETLVGSGVEVVPESVTINCPGMSYGAFSGETNVGVANGLIMTTGDAGDAAGPNNFSRTGSNNFSSETDEDLAALIPGFEIINACIIEFDFVPKSDTLTFNYVFGSEEYSEFVDKDFNDVFGFFVSGPGISGSFNNNAVNIAVVPDTEIPVSIQTINNGPADYGEPMGPCTNCEYFVFNGDGECFFNEESCNDETFIQYDGFTTVITAGIPIQPCEEYHIKLAIADSGDSGLDSGVFLQGQSFSTNGVSITAGGYEDGVNFPNAAAGCTNARLTFFNNLDVDQARTISYTIGGTAVEGTDFESIPKEVSWEAGETEVELIFDILDDGIANEDRVLEIYFENANCSGDRNDTISLIIEDFPVFSISEDQSICESDTADLIAENGFNYNWINSSISNPALPIQMVTPEDTTIYNIDIDYGRCKESLSTTVNVIKNCDGTECANEIVDISASAIEVCAGDLVTLSVTLDTLSANFSWDGPVTVTNGEFVAVTKSCAPTTQTYTVSASCFSDPNNTLTASIDITVYPSDITPFLNKNSIGCVVGAFPSRLCDPLISISERQVFDTCTQGQAVFEVSYNIETACIEPFEFIVDYDCTVPYAVGEVTVNEVYVCDGAKPDITISNFIIGSEASLYYAFHNNADLSNTGYTPETEIYGFSLDDLEEITQNNISCGQEIFVTPFIANTIEDLDNFSLNEECVSLGSTEAITFLCPIEISPNSPYVCDMMDNTGDLYVSITGGFPGLGNNTLYNVSGSLFEGTISLGEQIDLLELPDSTIYQIVAEDEIGCSASITDSLICSQIVPIELISFSGEAMPNGNQLKWVTATEINNAYFTVNTSKDGINFEKLITLNGNGNSNTTQHYDFLDRHSTNGTTYYQLLQTDFDGTTEIVGYVEITRGEIVNLNTINLFPNPVNGQLTIQFNQNGNQPVNISFTSLSGQLILSEMYEAQSGANELQINTASLSKGVYLVAIDTGTEVYYQKLMKQ